MHCEQVLGSLTVDSYFEGGISSVYLWDMDDGFAGCVLLKKGRCSNAAFGPTIVVAMLM